MNETIGSFSVLREPHLLQRLAVPLRVRAAEVAREALLDRLALAVADHQAAERPWIVASPVTIARVVAEHPVAVQLDEVVESSLVM
jgi:hypothetical protein